MGAPHKVTGVTNENVDNASSQTPAASGLPLRGLAMVLIAVAVMLGLWGLYALTSDDSGSQDSAGGAGDATATATAPQEQPAQSAQPEQPAQPTPGQETAPAQPGQENPPAAAEQPVERPAGQPAASEGKRQVNVLNNSTVQGLAADKARDIESAGFTLGQVGNFAEEVLPETTVFFPAGDAAAEAQARTLADKLGGVARENIQSLPAPAVEHGALTVVLVNQ